MYINILLPYKEKFSKNKASSVSITVFNNLEHSCHKKKIKIFGQFVDKPMFKENFIGLKKSINFFKSKNKTIADKMCKIINKSNFSGNIIEIHNRPYLIKNIKSMLKKEHYLTLFFHNDPLEMKGSKTVSERKYLLSNLHKIYCVSKYVKKKFLEGISNENDKKKIVVLYNGVKRKEQNPPKKVKEVIFVGRIVEEKGVQLYVDAIKNIYQFHKEWRFKIVGSPKLGEIKFDNFSNEIKKRFEHNGCRAKMVGFVNKTNLNKIMKRSSIIVIPSIWEEPFGLVAAEAMSHGIAIIASNVGGLPEIIGDNGILIKKINSKIISEKLNLLLSDKKILREYQKKSWDNFNLDSRKISKILDKHRDNFIS